MFAKSAWVLCACLLALASASSMEPRHSFRSGHEYSYDYNGQVSSSMSNGEQFSASRFRALVKLNFVSDKTVTVQLENPQMGQWNDYLDMPQELQKFDKFESVELKAEHLEKLNLPFQIRFTNGKISDLTFHSGDVTFSENIKRAIMNTLQVQLENPTENKVEEREADSYSFNLNETTIEGDCESLYSVRKTNSGSENVDSYNVTKTIDFTQCRYRPEFRYNYFRFAEPMEDSRQRLDEKTTQRYIHSNPALEVSSVYEFTLNGDRRQFLVKESKVLSTYSYEMMDAQRVRLITYAIAQASLKNVERKEPTDSLSSTKSAATLVYSDGLDVLRERFIAEGDETYLRQNPYMRMPNAASIVSTIMKRLLESSTKKTVEGIDEQATRYLTQLVSTLRLCSRSDIEQIHQQLFDSDEFEGIQKTFMQGILSDAMAIAGTKNTVDHLFKKIQNGDISTTKAATTLSKLINLRIVSSETVRNLERLCQESRVQESTMLKRTCMLTYGALVNAMCKVESPFKHADKYTNEAMGKYCDASTKNEITKNIISFYRKSSSRADKVLALKTIGNMGLENTVSFLEEIIRDWNVEKLIRIQAIDALRQMRKEIPRKVQRILLPVFQNRREHPEIRMNAVYQLLHSRPEKTVLDMIMTEMIREPNAHVKSFVSQLVYQMAESSHELYDRETATTLRSMLKHFRMYSNEERTPFFTSKFYSSVVAVDHSQFHEIASQFNFAALFSNDSRLPKEIMATVNLLSNSRMVPNTYQLGIHTQDIEQLFERLYNAVDSKTFDDIVTRGRRSITEESVNFLKGIYNRMKIATRRVSSETATPVVLLYTRYQNMDTYFCLTDEESLPQLIRTFIVDGRVDVAPWERKNIPFSWASASYSYEQQTKTPTIAGLPLLTTIRIPTITVLDGTVSTDFTDKEEESRIRSVRVHLKAEPKVATTVIVKMEVFSPLFTSGVKTFHSAQLRLPLNLIGKIHAPQWSPELEIVMPTEEVRLLHLQTRPVTFYRVWPAKSGVFIEAKEKTLIVEESTAPLKEKRINYVDPFCGLNVNIDAHWHTTPSMVSQSILGDWLLSGENAFELKIQPTAGSAKVLKLSAKALAKKSKDIPHFEIPNFEVLFGEQTEEMYAHTQKDERQLIREQMKLASGKLDNYYHLILKAEAIRGSRPHVATWDIKTLCDNRMTLCIARNHMDMDSDWSLKSVAQLAMPELRGVAGVPTQHFIAKVDTDFGSAEKNQIMFNIYGRPSVEKIEIVKRYMNRQTEKNLEFDAEDIFERAPRLLKPNDYKMVIENKLSPRLNSYMRTLYNFVRFSPFVNMPEPELLEQELAKPSQILMTRLIFDESKCNLTVTMPNKQIRLNWENSATESQAYGLVDVLRRTHSDDAQCIIKKGKFIRSFDGKSYKLPMTTCYTVLAKDCTENPEFVLMAKKMDKYEDQLKLKMVTRAKTYELYKKNNKMVVTVDNNILAERDFEENGIYKVANQEGLYEIRCRDTGASARFDGVNIIARIGSQYVNRQCGVCGHMNFDQSDDLRKADNEEASNLRDFHQSYLYKAKGECDPEAIEAVNRDSSEEGRDEEYRYDVNEDMENQENIQPVQRTVAVQHRERICFTQKPVKQCPEGSRQVGSTPEEVNVTCMKRSEHKAQRMLRQLRTQNVIELPEASEYSVDEKLSIKVPHTCVASDYVSESVEERRSQEAL